jgi:methionyl-tRNA synthetase
MAGRFYITTAIDYTNAAPHIGHAYEKILADVIARYHRLIGETTYFLTGVDQHGQKVQQSAEKHGVSPEAFVAGVTEKFTALWKKLELSNDGWAATTDPRHKRVVREALQRLFDAGEIYRDSYRGFYSVRQEQFLTEKERGPDGNFGEEWGEVVEIEEATYYFRLAKYRDWLLGFLDRHGDAVCPAFRHAELRNAAERIAGDLSISRPKARLSWGIELPFDPEFVTYVWFDALTNYLSFAGYGADPEAGLPQFDALWPALHLIGKDILIPAHGIYWLIMLKAMGFADEQMPRLLVHGFVKIAGAKMSKSTGNIVDPDALADRFGPDGLRYYLMRDGVVGQDLDFADERLVIRYNTDLANGLGNLLNRTLNMAGRYRGGALRLVAGDLAGDLPAVAAEAVGRYRERMDRFQIHAGIEAAFGLVDRANRFVEERAPWKLAKDPAAAEQLDATLYALAESLRIAAILLAPVIPRAAEEMLRQLALPVACSLAGACWGGIPDGHVVGAPTPIFPRIEPGVA